MPNVVAFHGRHTRTSASILLAKVVMRSAVTPAVRALSVPSTADHHSDGILSRCHHLVTRGAPAPVSAPIASRVAQSSMIDRKEPNSVNSDMQKSLGQFVLKIKPNVSSDCDHRAALALVAMDRDSASNFKAVFIARVKAAREVRFTQAEIAGLLEIPQDRYKQYETRSLLPHWLIPKFCLACGVTMQELFNPAPAKPAQRPARKTRRRVA